MSFDIEAPVHGGADCTGCPAYDFCELGTEQGSEKCRETLSNPNPQEVDTDG